MKSTPIPCRRSSLLAVAFLLAVALLLAAPGADATPPSWDEADCIRPGCHVELSQLEFDHGALARLRCGDCHWPDSQGAPPHPPSSDGEPPLPDAIASDRDCVRCHAESALRHGPESESDTDAGAEPRGADCLDCHDAHGGATADMLRGAGETVCMSCHAEEFEPARARRRQRDTEPKSDSDELEARLHGLAAEEGRCSACHRSHAENRPALLRGNLPPGAYARYDRQAYSACWEPCHDASLVEEAKTRSATGFRNGDDNLHYRHVVKPARGRSCRLCHAPHRARGPGLIRNGMPYGKEVLTLTFTPTKSGGKCATSCHLTVEYSRIEAIPSRIRVR